LLTPPPPDLTPQALIYHEMSLVAAGSSICTHTHAAFKAVMERDRFIAHAPATISRVFKNRLILVIYDLKSNQINCQKYDLKSQSNHHIHQCDLANLKIVPKLFKIRFCKIVNQIVEYSADF
jgi:hypothetical protein